MKKYTLFLPLLLFTFIACQSDTSSTGKIETSQKDKITTSKQAQTKITSANNRTSTQASNKILKQGKDDKVVIDISDMKQPTISNVSTKRASSSAPPGKSIGVIKGESPSSSSTNQQLPPKASSSSNTTTTSTRTNNSPQKSISLEQIEQGMTQPTISTSPKSAKTTTVEPTVAEFLHKGWDALLQKYVSLGGRVNYAGFKGDQAALDTYLKTLMDNPIQSDWNRKKKMAYWINAYNAFTIKLIVDNYPLSSIMKLDGGKPWDKKWIKLGDKTYSLNNIENDILRPQFQDARIHFAVNCAAKSCPTLLNRAWTENNLNTYFDKQATAFINNSSFNSISKNEIEISKIFEWYAVDFGNLIDYLNKYSTTKIDPNAKVTYKEYDWDLNQ